MSAPGILYRTCHANSDGRVDCSWCGQRPRRLFQYHGQYHGHFRGLFCNFSCLSSYHDIDRRSFDYIHVF